MLDTAGRLAIDDEPMDEVGQVRAPGRPHESLLAAEATTGQLAELDTFLLSEEDERLPIDEAHGFMALAVCHANLSDEELIEEDLW